MTWKLRAARYSDTETFSAPVSLENIGEPANVGIRWALPGGVQRLELTVRAKSQIDAYNRYRQHHGNRIVIYDNFADKPIAEGQVYEIQPDGRFVTYICAGAWQRHFDDLYTTADFSGLTIPTDETDVVIKDILSDAVSIENSDVSNIAATGVDIGGWHPEPNIGIYAGDAIQELIAIGNSTNDPLDYWLVSAVFSGILPQKPLAYLQARSASAGADWLISLKDLTQRGMNLSRHIWNYKYDVAIGYSNLTGTYTAGLGSSTVLSDSNADFINDGVTVGDTVSNITDGSTGEVTSVGSATQLTVHVLTGGSGNTFESADRYSIKMDKPKWTSAAQSAKGLADIGPTLWTVKYREIRDEMDVTQAETYRATLLDLFDTPVQQQAFTVGSNTIKDGNGVEWPLWRVIARGGGYIGLLDFAPEGDLFTDSLDRQQTARIVAADYTYSNNLLRLVPDSPDARLDVILARARLAATQVISTTPPQARTIGPPAPPQWNGPTMGGAGPPQWNI